MAYAIETHEKDEPPLALPPLSAYTSSKRWQIDYIQLHIRMEMLGHCSRWKETVFAVVLSETYPSLLSLPNSFAYEIPPLSFTKPDVSKELRLPKR
jgi:hypothetical protein